MFSSIIKNVSAEEAHKLINDNKEVIILDVRTKEEYDVGHIRGAKLVPVQVLSMKLSELMQYKSRPVLVYCASGGRSPRAVKTLASNDFTNLYHLTKGLSSWKYSLSR